MQNSLEYCLASDPEIRVQCVEEDDRITILWEDNGPGIPEKYRERVFDLFYTLDEKEGKSEGIGLAIVATLMQRLQGKVILSNRKRSRQGLCVELVFPKRTP